MLFKDRGLAVQDRQLSLVLAARVFDPTRTSIRARGRVILALRSGDPLRQTLHQTEQGDINVTMTTSRFGAKPSHLVRYVSARASDPSLVRTVTIPVGQYTWTLTMQATDAAAARDTDDGALARWILLSGIVITLLLSGLTLVLVTSRQRALSAVDHATAELRESDQRFRFAFEQAHAGMAVIDLKAVQPFSPLTWPPSAPLACPISSRVASVC